MCAREGSPVEAARFLGAAEALGDSVGLNLPALELARYQRELAAARAHLTEEEWAESWEEGRSMPADRAIVMALEAL